MRRSRFDIDHGELPSRQINPQQTGTSYLWIGSTGQLIQILNPGDNGYEENRKIVADAMHPIGETNVDKLEELDKQIASLETSIASKTATNPKA